MKRLLLILISSVSVISAHAQTAVDIPTDYIGLSGEVYISGRGEVLEVPFGYYSGGPSASYLEDYITSSIESRYLDDVITDVSVENSMKLLI